METLLQPQPEPVYIKAIVNGLCATAVLWAFWVPFIIVIAYPLTSNMIKDFICGNLYFAEYGASYAFNKSVTVFLYQLVNLSIITREEADTLMKKIEILGNSDIPAQQIINNDVNELNTENLPLTIIFIIFGLIIITISLFCAYLLCSAYNINGWNIIKFNIVMAIIIITIESFFFGFTTTRYIPFDIPTILSQVKSRIQSYLSNITAPPCTKNSFTHQTFYIDDWIALPKLDLDGAKELCLSTPSCLGITQSDTYGPQYQLTWTTVPSTHGNSGNSWTLNKCSKYQ